MLAVVELWSGELEAAVERFAAAERIAAAPRLAEPSMCWWRAEQVEALLELGRSTRPSTGSTPGKRSRAGSAATGCSRTRRAAAASSPRRAGDVDRALSLLEEAVAQHEAAGDPFGRARALLALGVDRRRARQKRRPRRDRAARAGFEELGAAGWAARARAELGGSAAARAARA